MRACAKARLSALIILGASFTMAPNSSHADVPDSVNYSGVLRTSGGAPVADGNYSVTFRVYDVSVGGVDLWAETKNITTVSGLFSTHLGSVTPLPHTIFSAPSRYLGITVSGDPEMMPRTPIVAVPYAYRIATVDGAASGTITGNLTVASGNITLGLSTPTEGNIMQGGLPFLRAPGVANTFLGVNSGNLASDADYNTGVGTVALFNNDTGDLNTANGYSALRENTTGANNTASGAGAMMANIGGGYNAAFGGQALLTNESGSNNTAIGYAADVSTTNLTNATAIGYGTVVTSSNSMMFGDLNVTRWGFGVNTAAGRAFQVGDDPLNGNGAYLTSGGTWTNTSDRNLKEGIALVNGSELLEQVNRLPVYRWNYKGEDASRQHVGPMAQDFHAVFGIGDDDKHISTIDPAGVALAAIRALYEHQKSDNEKLQQQIAELRELIRVQAEK